VEEILTIWPGEWVDGSDPKRVHEATLLSLSIEKAGALLGWYPAWDFKQAIHKTVLWYFQRHDAKNKKMLDLSKQQIQEYSESAIDKGLTWTR
jgi:dTDP-D-glucose 4,6-dehydratase